MSKEKLAPKVRFEEFSAIWKYHGLLDSVTKVIDFRGRTPKKLGLDWSRNGFLALSALNVKNGYIDKDADAHYGDRKLYNKWMLGNELHKGQVLFTTEAPMGNVAQVPDNNKYILSQRTIAFEVKENWITEDYLAVVLRTPSIFRELTTLSSGGTAKGVSQRTLSELDIPIPKDIREQHKIGEFFKKIDKMIQLQLSKLNKIKDIKSAYLSEMFPKEGEKYPKKRFEGFTEPWKKYNLGEIGYTISGVGFPNSEQGGKKGIMFLKVSDMNLSENTTEINTSNNFVTAFQVHKRNWKVIEEVPALIFAKVGAALLLDRKRLVNDKFLIDNNMMAYILGEKLVADFTNALFKKIYLPKYAQIGALPSMNDSIVEKIEVLIPSLEEQEKVGKFFNNLDNQISIEEEKLDKLEKLKQAYLNDMFI